MLRIVSIFFLFTIFYALQAQNPVSSAGTSSNLLLRFGTSAKVAGMSDAYSGLANDENALFYNPAGLTQMRIGAIGLNHAEWLEDIRIDNIVYGKPVSRNLVLGLSLTHMWMPAIQGKDQYGNQTTEFDVSSSIAQIGMAYRFHRYLSVGLALKYFQDNLAEYSAKGIAYDAGLHFRPIANRLSLGLVVQNLGSEVRYDRVDQNIPLTYRAGLALDILPGNLVIAADVSKAIDTDFRYHLGGAYTHRKFFIVRVGNRFSNQELLLPSFGIGFVVKDQFRLDYTFSNIPELGATHRVGFSFRFEAGPRYKTFSRTTKAIYPPSQVHASISKQKLNIKWKKMFAVQYNVYARYGTSGSWKKVNGNILNDNQYVSRIPLKPGYYYFKVTAVRSGMESMSSEIAVLHIEQKTSQE